MTAKLERIKATELQVGDWVDLAFCRYAVGDPISEFEYAVVSEVEVTDYDVTVDYENAECYTYPLDYSVWIVPRPRMPDEVKQAFQHVRKFHPEVTMVVFAKDGRWLYFDEDFNSPSFGDEIDISLLEAASDSLSILPATFQFSED